MDLPSLISETISGAQRVRDIVRGLKSFSHTESDVRTDFDLGVCVQDALKLLANEIKYRCDLSLDLQPIPKMNGYTGQIIQVITNLVLNSLQAMEGMEGRLHIRTWRNEGDGTIRMCVEDNGKGIQPDHLQQIFTPFFSTKPVGKGTGLGLSISYGIVKAHGGEITVRSQPYVKTEFEIIFRCG